MGGPQLLLLPASPSDRLKSTINNKRLGFSSNCDLIGEQRGISLFFKIQTSSGSAPYPAARSAYTSSFSLALLRPPLHPDFWPPCNPLQTKGGSSAEALSCEYNLLKYQPWARSMALDTFATSAI